MTIQLMQKFWNEQRRGNRKPTPLYGVQHGPGSSQPEGYVQGWSKEKKIADKMKARMLEVAEFSGEKLVIEVVIFMPFRERKRPLDKELDIR
jgi:hypothetical protein